MTETNFDNSLKLIAKSSFVVFIGLFLSKLFMYIYRAVIARYFGPEIYGLFSLSIMVANWFIVFSLLGFHQGILRFIPFYRGKNEINKIRHLFRFSFKTLLITSTISCILLFLLSEFISIHLFHNNDLIFFLKLFSLSIPLLILSQFFVYFLLSFEKINWYSFIYNIFQDGIKVLLLIILIFVGIGINALFVSYLLGIFLTLVLASFICNYALKDIFKRSTLTNSQKSKVFSEVFSYSWPLLFFAFVFYVLVWADSFLIGYFMDAKNVGYYNVAIPLSMLLVISSEFFTKLFSPLITKAYSNYKKNYSEIKELSKQVGKWIFLVNIPILFLVFIFSKEIIFIFFGKDYVIAANALKFLSIGMFFNSLSNVSQRLLSMAGKSKIILYDMIAVSFFNIFLNILLIKNFGISGAAFATMISLIFLNLLFSYQAHKFFSILPFRRKMLGILFITFIPAIFLTLIKSQLNSINFTSFFILTSFFFLSYALLILLTNCLDKNDLVILKSIGKKLKKKRK